VVTGIIQNESPSQPLNVTASGTFEGANTYTGGTTVTNAGALTLDGNGTILDTIAVDISNNAALVLDDQATAIQQRVNPNAVISFYAGQLTYQGSGSGSSQQNISEIDLTGASNTIQVNLNSGGLTDSALLTASQMVRESSNPTLYINLNTNGNPGSARFTLTTAPTLIGNPSASAGDQDLGILPWAISTVNGTDYLTYDANGFRTLASDEYASSPTTGDNLKLQSNQNISSSLTVNSMITTANLNIASGQTLTVSSGAVALSGSNASITGGSIAKLEFGAQEAVLYSDNASTQIDAVIDGSAGLTKFGPGTLSLTQSNTDSGATVVNEGTLDISAAGGLGSGTIQFPGVGGGILKFDTVDQAYSNTVTVPSNINGTGTIEVAAGRSVTLSGPINGTGIGAELQKAGAGTLKLTDGGSDIGILANAGTVEIDSVFSGFSEANPAFGGTVSGNGTIHFLGLGGDGTLAPTGRLTGSLLENAGSGGEVILFHLDGPNAGTTADGYDQILLNGLTNSTTDVVLGTSDISLDIALGFTPNVGERFVLIDNQNSGGISGNFTGLSEGSDFTVNNVEFQITYQADADNDGIENDVVLTVVSVPEPASAAIVLIPMALVLTSRRRTA
jgi:autotransporter-associated beta strand protein